MQEVVIVSAVRTPIGQIRGALSQVRADDLAALVIREAVCARGWTAPRSRKCSWAARTRPGRTTGTSRG